MTTSTTVYSPDAPQLDELCDRLRGHAESLETPGAWPAEQLRWCGDAGVFEWFADEAWGGQNWSDADIVRGYLKLSEACLTTTFVITQRTGAFRRIAASEKHELQRRYLPLLVDGTRFATVGISHLTTSRRHEARPVLRAEPISQGFRLDGFSPWVTGADAADIVVTGATLVDGRQILVVVPTHLPGVSVPQPAELVGLSATRTGAVHFEGVEVDSSLVLAGPIENVMSQGKGAGTGGLQTSTLALGLAAAALRFLEGQADIRGELTRPAQALRSEWDELSQTLHQVADGHPVCSTGTLRGKANSLVLRATQAALSAAKGTGYIIGHPTGRWCREALFFLVWSCPQPVLANHLCEFARLESLE